jgi:hypothetical protein
MMRKALVILAAVLFVSSVALTAQVRTTKPNDVSFELGGKCALYSLAYQRAIGTNFALTADVSMLGATGGGDTVSAFFIGGGARFYLLKKDATPYISGGFMYVTADTDAGPFDGEGGFYGYVSPGFEYRSSGGFVFRGGIYIIIVSGEAIVWPGLSLGYSF